MKTKFLNYFLIVVMGCAAINERVNAKNCPTVTISGDSNLKNELVMFTAPCGQEIPGWEPLKLNTPISLRPGFPFKIANKNTSEVLFNRDLVGDIHMDCLETPNGPQCLPPPS